MASYQERADQAITDQQWAEADELLGRGVIATPFVDNAYRMELRRIALPLYRDAVRYEQDMPSQLSDATAEEVYEEARSLLQYTHEGYQDMCMDLDLPTDSRIKAHKEYAGVLTEQTVFTLGIYARAHQLDEVLFVPSGSSQDLAYGRFAHDLGAYHQAATWHRQPRISLQVKHFAAQAAVRKYAGSVIVMGYRGEDELGIDDYHVTVDGSLSRAFADNNEEVIEELASNSYDRARNLLINWPGIRDRVLGNLAASRALTHRLDLSRFKLTLPEA
jgi:hypothetical protein